MFIHSAAAEGIDINGVSLAEYNEQLYLKPWQGYQDLLAISPQFNQMSHEDKLWWLIRKIEAEHLLFFYEDFKQTLQQVNDVLSEDPTSNLPSEITITINLFSGILQQKESQYTEAITTLELALTQAKQHNNLRLAIRAKQELAYTLSLTEHFENSLADLQLAYIDAFALKNDFLIATINEVYGAIYGYMNDYAKSINYYEKALASYLILGYPSYIADALNGLAATYRYWDKYELAVEHYERYRQVVTQFNNPEILFFADYGLGMTLAEQGQCARAITVIDRALALKGHDDYKAELYKRKAECLIEFSRLDEAEVAINHANTIFKMIPELVDTRWQNEVMLIAAKLAYAQDNYQKAYQLLDQYHQKNTALVLEKSSERLAKLKSNLELERQGVESALLQQRAKVLELQVNQQMQRNELQTYIIFFSVVFLLLIIVVLVLQQRSAKKINNLSVIEPLTGLFNRRYSFAYLDKLLSSSSWNKNHVAVLLVDIADLKSINNLYGEAFGDTVIKSIATITQNALRGEDVVGRIAGGEFLCILSRLGTEQEIQVSERIVENVARQDFRCNGKKVDVAVNIGIAIRNAETHDSATLYSQADEALTEAKKLATGQVFRYRRFMVHPQQDHDLPKKKL
ncbi:tetratricopeptide repeat-containing diguanylate cyclase [Litorilituus lipolyticus]|uniref:diguanylate cyclase n=1 Tax=Litorilituus lipolyticus TaxID=2491017 RepID=A0A502L185_9GAMM|nr:tetratricopeptide repeat-containing diguanylate cyclase [Litorilituus lipolyticus]TPH17638.1 diguanylate cyclase [Litorilituus lipolyticus]